MVKDLLKEIFQSKPEVIVVVEGGCVQSILVTKKRICFTLSPKCVRVIDIDNLEQELDEDENIDFWNEIEKLSKGYSWG